MANIFIKTFGCALNQSDSEIMAGILTKEKHNLVNNEFEADIIIINSCTVKDEAENKLYREIRKHKDKKIIIAGCVAQAEQSIVETKLKDYSIIGTSQIHKIGEVVKNLISDKRTVMLTKEKTTRINLPSISKNKKIRIIPISEGCLGNCTYCKTKQARGELFSYKINDIVSEIKKAVGNGANQIWLTSQDTGAYGLDINETLPSLLGEVIKIKGDFKVRLGMCNPNFALKYVDKLIAIFNSDKMFKFIHIPLQSGSNHVLNLMMRGYKKEDFLKLTKKLKKNIPSLTFATDIIIGFPEESHEDFSETIELIKLIQPDVLNMSRFWKRPGTKAAKMKQLDSKLIKQRSIKLRQLFHEISLQKNKEWIGWSGDAIFDGLGKNNLATYRNYSYKPVLVRYDKTNIKEKIRVKITNSSLWDLRGEILIKK